MNKNLALSLSKDNVFGTWYIFLCFKIIVWHEYDVKLIRNSLNFRMCWFTCENYPYVCA